MGLRLLLGLGFPCFKGRSGYTSKASTVWSEFRVYMLRAWQSESTEDTRATNPYPSCHAQLQVKDAANGPRMSDSGGVCLGLRA